MCWRSPPDYDKILMFLPRDISVALDTNPCSKIITKGARQSSHLFSRSISFHLTSQVHRVWRVQRELLWDESRLSTLCPLQEQSVLIGCPASCEWHKTILSKSDLCSLFPVFLALATTDPTYLRSRSLCSLVFLRPLLLTGLPKWVLKGAFWRSNYH